MAGIGIEHFGAFAVIGALFAVAHPRHLLLIAALLLGAAVLLELAQLLVPGRHGRVVDAAVKIAGGFTGIAFAVALNRWVLLRA